MLTIKKILFATDFSHGAEWAGLYARSIARATGAELHVLYADVLHGDAAAAPGRWTGDAAYAQLEAAVKATSDREKDLPEIRTQRIVRRNFSPAPAILDYAAEEDVDLIVTGTHGRRGITRLVLGSVAEEVVRLSQRPVLTVRARSKELPASVTVGPIIAPIDFSTHSATALAYAGEMSRLFHADLHLIHVVEETLHPAFYGLTVQSIYDVNPMVEEKAEKHMMKLLETVVGNDAKATIKAMPGKAAPDIAEYAAEYPNAIIVMATHGLTGIEHFLIGSTTERVVRNSTVPVFSVKSFGKALIKTDALIAAKASVDPLTRAMQTS